jgi:hypothetical protein
MLGMETVAERVPYYFVGHRPAMPGSGKTSQSIHTPRGLEDGAHALRRSSQEFTISPNSMALA